MREERKEPQPATQRRDRGSFVHQVGLDWGVYQPPTAADGEENHDESDFINGEQKGDGGTG